MDILSQAFLLIVIRMTLNTEFYPLKFVRAGVLMTRLTKMHDTCSPESWFCGAVDQLSLISIA